MRSSSAALWVTLVFAGCVPRPESRLPERAASPLEPALTQVTAGRSGEDRDPEVTKDGRLLFYASTSFGGTFDLYVRSVGSNTATRLTTGPGDKRFPRISPTRPRMLAYCSNERGRWEICLLEDYAEPSSPAIVLSDPGTDNLHPSWSPDGRKLVYCSTRERGEEDWVLKIKDLVTGKTHVLETVDGLLPDWSPSGNRIVFQRMKHRDDWLSSLWTVDFENGSAHNLCSIFSSDDWAAINPAWSPDGKSVAFATVAKGQGSPGTETKTDDLWIVGSDGLNPTRLTVSPAADWMPCWAADGRLYFVSDRSGSHRIWSLTPPR